MKYTCKMTFKLDVTDEVEVAKYLGVVKQFKDAHDKVYVKQIPYGDKEILIVFTTEEEI